jgi:hypothetical protein
MGDTTKKKTSQIGTNSTTRGTSSNRGEKRSTRSIRNMSPACEVQLFKGEGLEKLLVDDACPLKLEVQKPCRLVHERMGSKAETCTLHVLASCASVYWSWPADDVPIRCQQNRWFETAQILVYLIIDQLVPVTEGSFSHLYLEQLTPLGYSR